MSGSDSHNYVARGEQSSICSVFGHVSFETDIFSSFITPFIVGTGRWIIMDKQNLANIDGLQLLSFKKVIVQKK